MDEFMVDAEMNKINIDEVFENIISVYDSHVMHIIHHMLLLVQQETDPVNLHHIMEGLHHTMAKYRRPQA